MGDDKQGSAWDFVTDFLNTIIVEVGRRAKTAERPAEEATSSTSTGDQTSPLQMDTPTDSMEEIDLLNRSTFVIPETTAGIEARKRALLNELQVIEDAQIAQALDKRQQARDQPTQLRAELIAALEDAIAVGTQIRKEFGHRQDLPKGDAALEETMQFLKNKLPKKTANPTSAPPDAQKKAPTAVTSAPTVPQPTAVPKPPSTTTKALTAPRPTAVPEARATAAASTATGTQPKVSNAQLNAEFDRAREMKRRAKNKLPAFTEAGSQCPICGYRGITRLDECPNFKIHRMDLAYGERHRKKST